MPWRVRQRVRSQRENRWRGSYQFPTVDSVIIPCALMVRLRCIRGTKIVHATQNSRIPRSGPIRPPGFGTSTADSQTVGFGGVSGRTVADDPEAECRAERVLLKARRAPLSSKNWLRNSYLHLAYRANELHDDQPDSVASMSVKPRFLALLSRGSSTPWKIERNPFIFCLRTLLFVVVLTEERYHEAEMKNGNFKSEGAEFVLHAIYEMDQMYYILCSEEQFCIFYRSDSEIESKHCFAASCAPRPRQTR